MRNCFKGVVKSFACMCLLVAGLGFSCKAVDLQNPKLSMVCAVRTKSFFESLWLCAQYDDNSIEFLYPISIEQLINCRDIREKDDNFDKLSAKVHEYLNNEESLAAEQKILEYNLDYIHQNREDVEESVKQQIQESTNKIDVMECKRLSLIKKINNYLIVKM